MTFMLLGNGYDLHHKFPTRYIDFLQTVHFLMEQESIHVFALLQMASTLRMQKIVVRILLELMM